MYPTELEIKDTTESNTSASYSDLLLSIESDGQLRTSLYDKRDDFNFHITNFPFLSSNIPSSPAYGVFISQLIRYARACSSYECFILRAARLSSKLIRQGYVMERLKSSLRPKSVGNRCVIEVLGGVLCVVTLLFGFFCRRCRGFCHSAESDLFLFSQEVLWSIRGSHQTLWSLPLPNVTWHSGTWP